MKTVKIVYIGAEKTLCFAPVPPYKKFETPFNVPVDVPKPLADELMRSGGHNFITFEDWISRFGDQSAPAPNLDEEPLDVTLLEDVHEAVTLFDSAPLPEDEEE